MTLLAASLAAACGDDGDEDGGAAATDETTETSAHADPASGSGGSDDGTSSAGTLTYTFDLRGPVAVQGTLLDSQKLLSAESCADAAESIGLASAQGDVGGHRVRIEASGQGVGTTELDFGSLAVDVDGQQWAGDGQLTVNPDGSGSLELGAVGSITDDTRIEGTISWTCEDA